jgi:hypothetical protein
MHNFNLSPGYNYQHLGQQQFFPNQFVNTGFNNSFDAQQYSSLGFSPSPQRSTNSNNMDQFSPISTKLGDKRKTHSSNSLKGLGKAKAKTSLFSKDNEKDEEYNSLEEILSKINCEIDVYIKTQKGSRYFFTNP